MLSLFSIYGLSAHELLYQYTLMCMIVRLKNMGIPLPSCNFARCHARQTLHLHGNPVLMQTWFVVFGGKISETLMLPTMCRLGIAERDAHRADDDCLESPAVELSKLLEISMSSSLVKAETCAVVARFCHESRRDGSFAARFRISHGVETSRPDVYIHSNAILITPDMEVNIRTSSKERPVCARVMLPLAYSAKCNIYESGSMGATRGLRSIDLSSKPARSIPAVSAEIQASSFSRNLIKPTCERGNSGQKRGRAHRHGEIPKPHTPQRLTASRHPLLSTPSQEQAGEAPDEPYSLERSTRPAAVRDSMSS